MKQKPPPPRERAWLAKTGWALAAVLLVAIGLLEQRRHAESIRRQEESARSEKAGGMAARFLYLYTNAPAASNMVEVLRGIPAVSTDVLVAEPFQSRVDSAALKTRLNLEVVKRGVPIDPRSKYELALVVDGKWYEADGRAMPLVSMNLNESVPVQRPFGFNLISVASYRASRFAIVRTNQVPDVVAKMIESLAESFSIDYKSANAVSPSRP